MRACPLHGAWTLNLIDLVTEVVPLTGLWIGRAWGQPPCLGLDAVETELGLNLISGGGIELGWEVVGRRPGMAQKEQGRALTGTVATRGPRPPASLLQLCAPLCSDTLAGASLPRDKPQTSSFGPSWTNGCLPKAGQPGSQTAWGNQGKSTRPPGAPRHRKPRPHPEPTWIAAPLPEGRQ